MAIALRKFSIYYNYFFFSSFKSSYETLELFVYCKHYIVIIVSIIDCALQLFGHNGLFHFMVDVLSYNLLMENVICWWQILFVETWSLKVDVMVYHLMTML